MAALTNVWAYTRDGSEPKKVVAADVQSGRVSRYSSFFCKYCWEDVSFVPAGHAIAYFKHSKNPEKTCIQKFSGEYSHSSIKRGLIASGAYVRIRPDADVNNVHVEMCLPPVSEDLLRLFKQNNSKVTVSGDGHKNMSFSLFDHAETKGMFYLDLGAWFSMTYYLNTDNTPKYFSGWTPRKSLLDSVNAFDPEGILFSSVTGRRLPYEGHAVVGDEYYYVQRGYEGFCSKDVSRELLLRSGEWRCYLVKATEYSESSVRQFGKMGAILSCRKEAIVPLWPEHVQRDDLVCIEPKREPFVSCVVSGITEQDMIGDFSAESRLIESRDSRSPFPQPIVGNNFWDKVTPGYTKNLSLWRSPLIDKAGASHVDIVDFVSKNERRQFGYASYDRLPVKKQLVFTPLNDGWLKVDGGPKVRKNYYLKAGKEFFLNVCRGMRIAVYQGLDMIGEIEFPHRAESVGQDQALSLEEKAILSAEGCTVGASSAFEHLLAKISGMPELANIIRSDIKRDKLTYRSVALIRKKILNLVKEMKDE